MRTWIAMLLCCLLPGVAASSNSAGARHALIVAVSNYAVLPARDDPGAKEPFDLAGPKHDALAMIRVAMDIGVPRKNMIVLADGVLTAGVRVKTTGLPTHDTILLQLENLTKRVRAGDQVLVYFSGHGSYQPDQDTLENGKDEADGFDEILLPIDVGAWNDAGATVTNAITDDEFGRRVRAISDRGAYVWVIVDACHSGTALRGTRLSTSNGLEIRSVQPAALGVPKRVMANAGRSSSIQRGTGQTQAQFESAQDLVEGSGAVTAFYAATAQEAAISGRWKLPDGSLTEPMGLLTFTIQQALAGGRVRTYHDLALRVSAAFDLEGNRAPVPAFDGNMDRTIFGHDTVPPARWAVEQRGQEWVLQAGLLDGIRESAIVEISSATADKRRVRTYARVDAVKSRSATLVAVGHGGTSEAALRQLSRFGAYVGRVVESGVPVVVTVALLPANADYVVTARKIQDAANYLARQGEERLDLRVEWVKPPLAADLYLVPGNGRVWFSQVPDDIDAADRAQPLWMPVEGNASTPSVASALGTQIAAFARTRSLLRVLGEMELEDAERKSFTIDLYVDRVSLTQEGGAWPESQPCGSAGSILRSIPERAMPITQAWSGGKSIGPLRHCDVLYARVRNVSNHPVDFTPLYFDRSYGITYLESGRRDGARIPPGDSRTFLVQINTFDSANHRPYPIGVEQLAVVVVSQSSDDVPVADYSYLALGPRPPNRAGVGATSLDRLLDAAGFGAGVTGRSMSIASGEATAVRYGLMITAE